ncbi:hypothetical protein BGZ65_012539, partial [Modicella reniformis]
MPENPTLRQVVVKLLKVFTVMIISYVALMALYFAAEYNASSRLKNINILVADLDHSIIGDHFLSFTRKDNDSPGQVNWSVQSGYKDVESVIVDVENGNYWGAIVVQANATSMLLTAASEQLVSYNPTKAFLFIYDGGRDPVSVKRHVVASMYIQFAQFIKIFNLTWITLLLTTANDQGASLAPLVNAPQILGTPVAFEERDLHQPTTSIITSATSVAYIWIFLVAGGSTYLVAHCVQPLTRSASVRRTMVLLLLPLFVFLFSFSMAYTVLLWGFGVPFESAGQFIFLFMGMLLLQSAVASLVLFLVFLIPVVFIPLITITFMVMNVIAVFHPVELMPLFYRWVYAMPFLNAVQLARYVLMGSYNQLAYNLPILFAWVLVPLTLLPFAITRQKRLMMEVLALEGHERQRDKQRSYSDKDTDYRHQGGERDYDPMAAGVGTSRQHNRSNEAASLRYGPHRSRGQGESVSVYDNPSQSVEDELERRPQRHHHHHLRDSMNDDSDVFDEEDDDDPDGMDVIENNAAVLSAAQRIRPLRPPGILLGSRAVPSAPPETQ